MRAATLLMAVAFTVLSSAAFAQTNATNGTSTRAPARQLSSLPEIDTGSGLDTVVPDGVSTKTVKAVPCSTAARETDSTITCTGTPKEVRE
jgi:hypothetical protein